MEKFINTINKFQEVIGKCVSWLSLLLVLVICYDVITRYFFNHNSVALQELEWHLFAALFLFAAGYTLKHDAHVRIDLFYSKYSEKKKAVVDLLGIILFLIPFCFVTIYSSYDFVANSFMIGEVSPDGGGLPARYIIKSVIPVSFALLLLQSLAMMFANIQKIFSKEKE